MTFEEKKQEIIDELNELNASCEPMQYSRYSWLFDKISELKPDYPTCNTCKKTVGWCSLDLIQSEVDSNFSLDEHGCIHHSSLEGDN